MERQRKFAPRVIFEQMLEWGVMPCFDLVVKQGGQGVIIVKRKIAPYKGVWALPGLRQYKGERFRDTLARIAKSELGLKINPRDTKILEQYDGFFSTENQRQDISTGYCIQIPEAAEIILNRNHFSSSKFVRKTSEIPKNMGAMYKFHLKTYFEKRICSPENIYK